MEGGIGLQLGKLQWQLYWEISVLLVCFFIAQMSVFLNSLLIRIGVKGILGVQITEHVLLFHFSVRELLAEGCNHVSCWFLVSVKHYFMFLWFLSSLFAQGKQKGKLDQEKELWAVALLKNALPGLALGYFIHVFQFTCLWGQKKEKNGSAFLKTL